MSNNWQGFYPPPPPPQYYPVMYQPPTYGGPPDPNTAIEILKGQLKEAKKAKKKEEAKKSGDKKPKEFWRKAEVASILFMTAPILALIEIGIIKACLVGIRTLMN